MRASTLNIYHSPVSLHPTLSHSTSYAISLVLMDKLGRLTKQNVQLLQIPEDKTLHGAAQETSGALFRELRRLILLSYCLQNFLFPILRRKTFK